MAELTYTIANAKVADYIEAYCYIHKNMELKPNPEYLDEEKTPNVEREIIKYTNTQWVREHILRSIKGQIIRGKVAMARDAMVDQNADEVT